MSELSEPLQDVKRWWLILHDGTDAMSAEIAVSGRERLMNTGDAAMLDLLAARFHRAATTVREEWLRRVLKELPKRA